MSSSTRAPTARPWRASSGARFDQPPIDTPFAFVVARRDDRIVLVDTGFMRERGGARMAEKFGVPRWISPVRMLEELGIGAGDVTDIVLSHAHFDHAGSIDQFPRAHIHSAKSRALELDRGHGACRSASPS